MKYKFKFAFLLLFVFVFNTISSQNIYKSTIYDAYIHGDMKKWESVILILEKQNPESISGKLELISYYYGYIGYLLGIKNYDLASKYIDKGDKLIAQVLKQAPKNATAYAFKGSFIGFRIGMSRFKAITLGPESNKNIAQALKLEPANIQAIVDNANVLYHTPRLFGGDKSHSLKLFLKSITLFEKKELLAIV